MTRSLATTPRPVAPIFGVEALSDMVLALGFAGGEPAIWIGEWTD